MKNMLIIVFLIAITFCVANLIYAADVNDSSDFEGICDIHSSNLISSFSSSFLKEEPEIDSFGPWEPGSPFPEIEILQI